MKNLIFVLCTIFTANVFGHSANETAYVLQKEGQHWILNIHFTPVSAMTILEERIPTLQNSSVINLVKYHQELADYFSETITIILGNQKADLSLMDANLKNHDSILRLKIENSPVSFTEYDITINSMTELYNRPRNLLQIVLPDGAWECNLTEKNRRCASATVAKATNPPVTQGFFDFISILIILIAGIALGGIFAWRSQSKLKANPSELFYLHPRTK